MPPRLGQTFEPGGDVDAVAEDVALLDDDVALVNADAKLDATVRRQWFIALGQSRLHLGCAAQRVDNAGELDQEAVAGGLDDAAMMAGNLRINYCCAERFEPAERPFFVGLDQARITGDIGREDRREPTFDTSWRCGLHGASLLAKILHQQRPARIKQAASPHVKQKGAPEGALRVATQCGSGHVVREADRRGAGAIVGLDVDEPTMPSSTFFCARSSAGRMSSGSSTYSPWQPSPWAMMS